MAGKLFDAVSRWILPWLRPRLKTATALWNDFWFRPGDPFLLGVLRLLTGWMVFYNLCVWTLDLETFFGRDGLQPLQAVRRLHESRWIFSFWMWIDDGLILPVHLVCLVVTALFCAGAFTRVTSVLSYLITISYSQRVPVANFGLDQLMGILCLYLAMAPSGAAMSLDAWWKSRQWTRSGRAGRPIVEKRSSVTMVSRLIQLHLCAIYFWAGHAKLKGPTWWTGEAMWNVLANQEYQTCDLTWLASFPWVPYLVAHVTILWEVFFPVLVWNRTLRPLMLWLGFGMHVGIGAFLGMWTFGLIMGFAYLAFLDAEYWRACWYALLDRRRIDEPRLTDAAEGDSDSSWPILTADSSAAVGASSGLTAVPPPSLSSQTDLPSETSAVPSQTRLLLVAATSPELYTMQCYFSERGFDCHLASTPELAKDLVVTSRAHAVIIHGKGFAVEELSAFADFACGIPDLTALLLLPEKLHPVSRLLTEVRHVDWMALPLSLTQVRLRLQAMMSGASAVPVPDRATDAATPDSVSSSH